jgi:hypothetical protein
MVPQVLKTMINHGGVQGFTMVLPRFYHVYPENTWGTAIDKIITWCSIHPDFEQIDIDDS